MDATPARVLALRRPSGKDQPAAPGPEAKPRVAGHDTALAEEKIRVSIEGKQVVKAIIVPNKLVNFVVRD